MTTIEKLGISGVRSYGPDREAVLKFQRPLTIILGQNGSGKSTIIEAVKMATSGDLPPMVSQGAAFINDPRIRNAVETNAKIRLQFTNVRGEEYLVSRHFSLRMTRTGKPEFKTIDQTLKRSSNRNRRRKRLVTTDDEGGAHYGEPDDGERQQHSTSLRCAELNILLPELMRITKPILNSVVFVHQEDSLWPLGDPKKLKERFDDIFAATRYTKALESIRKFRREQSAELRVVNSELLRHEQSVKVCEKLREEAEDIRSMETKLRAGVDAIQTQVTEIERVLDRAQKVDDEYKALEQKLTKFEATLTVLEKDRKEKYEMLSENLVDLGDDELERLIDDLESAMRRADGEKRDRSSSLEHATNELEELSRSFHQSQKHRGLLEAEAAQQSARLAELESLKRRYVAQLYPSAKAKDVLLEAPSLESGISEWSMSLKTLGDKARRKAHSVTMERRHVEDNASETVSALQAKLSTEDAVIRQHRLEASEKRALAARKRSELHELADSVSSDAIATAKAEEARCAAAYQAFLKAGKVAEAELLLVGEKEEDTKLRRELDVRKRERDELSRDQLARVAVQHRKEELQSKLRSLSLATEDLVGKVEDSCASIGVEWDISKEAALAEVDKSQEMRNRSLKMLDRLVSRRDRLQDECDRALRLAQQAHSNATNTELNVTTAAVEDSRALENAEVALGGLRSEMLDDVRGIVGDEDLIASTVAVADNRAGLTMLPSNVEAVALLEGKLLDAQKRASLAVARSKSSAAYLKRALEYFDAKGRCMTCGHAGNEQERMAQREYMEDVLRDNAQGEGVSKTVLKWEERLRQVEKSIKWVTRLSRHGDIICGLRETAHASQQRAKETSAKVAQTSKSRDAAESAARDLEAKFGTGSPLMNALAGREAVLRLADECANAQKQYDEACLSLPAESVSRCIADVEKEVRDVEAKVRRCQERVEERRLDLDALKDEKARLESSRSRSRERALLLERQYEKQRHLEQEKDELTAASRELDGKATSVAEALVQVRSEVKKHQEIHASLREESSRILDSCSKFTMECDGALASWTMIAKAVETYRSGSKPGELARLERHMKVTKDSIERLQADVKQHTKDVESAGDALREKSAELRNATDNQRYRTIRKELDLVQGQAREARRDLEILVVESTRIASELLSASDAQRAIREAAGRMDVSHSNGLAEKMSSRDPEDASKKEWGGKRSITRMSPGELVQELVKQCNSRRALWHATMGKAQVYTERWKAKQEEIQEADRLGSMRQYEKCRITKQTMELASTDLDKYHRALDQALMSFHALKMDTINKSIRELWQATYRGNDIDEIEVVSDPGDGGASGTSSSRRNYNYRVVMRRGDAKLDMRGRCSAGQKVLACLVIRLALAESFCSNCGILALDEPTTNLDRDNVESLAMALRAIIENRRSQSHFQLILISHDQDFLSMMSARSYSDHYLVVYKDAAGYSNVKEQDIRMLED